MNDGRARHFLAEAAGTASPFALALAEAPAPFAARVVLAGDSSRRRRGLLGRDGLDDDEALVIAPTQGVHTFGMRFPIDIVFADRHGRVLRVATHVPPNRVRVSWRAFAAVELGSGRSAVAGVFPGMRIEVRLDT